MAAMRRIPSMKEQTREHLLGRAQPVATRRAGGRASTSDGRVGGQSIVGSKISAVLRC